MKKILLVLLVTLGLQTQAQILNWCDSISYSTSSSINNPFGIWGYLGTIPSSTSWTWTVCNSNLCFSDTGPGPVFFGQVSLTDTLKVCYDVLIDINGIAYACTNCDSLIYDGNQWVLFNTGNPTGIQEVDLYSKKCLKMFDLLGRELNEVPVGTMYIRNRKLYITR